MRKISFSLDKITKPLLQQNKLPLEIVRNWKWIVGDKISQYSSPVKISQFVESSKNIHLADTSKAQTLQALTIMTSQSYSMQIMHSKEKIIHSVNSYMYHGFISKINIIQSVFVRASGTVIRNNDRNEFGIEHLSFVKNTDVNIAGDCKVLESLSAIKQDLLRDTLQKFYSVLCEK
jgi:hypothetical protein